ncbi:DUF6979 family protein [Brevibacillus brevis]|uniref:DUF6979 family protein n=1 Tax=Brevibacillus brevis TaxID=1393 RepID=UPI003D28D51F
MIQIKLLIHEKPGRRHLPKYLVREQAGIRIVRVALLGLCEEGFVRGITRGKYTNSLDNKAYALQAAALLVKDPTLSQSPSTLWKAINIQKSHNSQMDVVISLWENKLILK